MEYFFRQLAPMSQKNNPVVSCTFLYPHQKSSSSNF